MKAKFAGMLMLVMGLSNSYASNHISTSDLPTWERLTHEEVMNFKANCDEFTHSGALPDGVASFITTEATGATLVVDQAEKAIFQKHLLALTTASVIAYAIYNHSKDYLSLATDEKMSLIAENNNGLFGLTTKKFISAEDLTLEEIQMNYLTTNVAGILGLCSPDDEIPSLNDEIYEQDVRLETLAYKIGKLKQTIDYGKAAE